MDLQIFQIPKMSFQTPSGWESAKARGPWQALPNSHSPAAWAGGLGSSSQIWGPLCEEGGLAAGPVPLVPGSCSGLLTVSLLLKYESDSFCESPS